MNENLRITVTFLILFRKQQNHDEDEIKREAIIYAQNEIYAEP